MSIGGRGESRAQHSPVLAPLGFMISMAVPAAIAILSGPNRRIGNQGRSNVPAIVRRSRGERCPSARPCLEALAPSGSGCSASRKGKVS